MNEKCNTKRIHYFLCPSNLREINAYALKTFKNVRYNSMMSHIVYGDLLAQIPPPKWYDYIIQAILVMGMLAYSAIIVMGVPLPPPIVFETLLIDYRYYFYVSRADAWARWKVVVDYLQILERKKLIKTPNHYLDLYVGYFEKCSGILQNGKVNLPPNVEYLQQNIIPKEVWEFNIHRPMEELKKKAQ